jgi:hypothetical protein
VGNLEYKEVNWDDPDVVKQLGKIHRSSVLAWILGFSFFVLLVAIVALPGRLFLSASDLALQEQRRYNWLNRCDRSCEKGLQLSFLHQQKSCAGLEALYGETVHSRLFYWRLALDDRASSLGCPSFPKPLSQIRAESRQALDAASERRMEHRTEGEEAMRRAQEQVFERYLQSLQEGGLSRFVSSVEQDDFRVLVVLSDRWEALADTRKQTMADALWQKWASIVSPRNLQKAQITLFSASGATLGISTGKGVDLY